MAQKCLKAFTISVILEEDWTDYNCKRKDFIYEVESDGTADR